MPNLNTLANYAEILGVLSIVAGIVFAIVQIRQLRRQRTELTAVELIRAWQTPEFAMALKTLQLLPDNADLDSLSDNDAELEDMAFVVGMFFEGVGVMVYRNLISLEIVNDLMGGVTRVVWTKLSVWVREWRVERNPRAYEWWEWLTQQLDDRSPLLADSES